MMWALLIGTLIGVVFIAPVSGSECSGFSTVNGTVGCDDNNTVAGDGCFDCEVEAGWVCHGHLLSRCFSLASCATNAPPDCIGVCGGRAFIDACDVCAGNGTGKIPDVNKDNCGVCFGNNADLDDCKVCFGRNLTKDVCGVCFGNNATCRGCDGIPNSGRVVDICGVCSVGAARNQTCMGCDGIPVPLGGKIYDMCGVCGGNHTAGCFRGCDGILDSLNSTDCAGVCGGSASLDLCGVCSGGTTGRTPNQHRFNGACFGNQTACVHDACGVCGGDNSTCLGCNAKPMPAGGKTYDLCGSCGGTRNVAGTCRVGCRFAPDNSTVVDVVDGFGRVDCAGRCNGTAKRDNCGACVSPPFPIGFPLTSPNMDSCGNCFGGDALKDYCGYCNGANKNYDNCHQCTEVDPHNPEGPPLRGGNIDLDKCQVCFGNNTFVDVCGLCFGNGSSCVGCDNVPLSGLTIDACGICGGNATTNDGCLPPGNSLVVSTGIPLWITLVTAGAVVFCLGICIAITMCIYKRRERNFVKKFEEDRAKELASAPTGEVTIVFTDVQDSTVLWEKFPDEMPHAVELHHAAARELIKKHHGYEVKTEGDAFMVAFPTQLDAVKWAMAAQLRYLELAYPQPVVNYTGTPEEFDKAKTRRIFRGLRVRMGIHCGHPRCKVDPKTKIMDYLGRMVNRAARIMGSANGGQVLISGEVYDKLKAWIDDKNSAVVTKDLGKLQFKGIKGLMQVYQILPLPLRERTFPEVKSYVQPVATRAAPGLEAKDAMSLAFDYNSLVGPYEEEDPDDPESYGIMDFLGRTPAPPRRPANIPVLNLGR